MLTKPLLPQEIDQSTTYYLNYHIRNSNPTKQAEILPFYRSLARSITARI